MKVAPTHLGLAPSPAAGQRLGVGSATAATVLVLEENAAVQELVEQALHESGHRVLATKNALEALEVVRRVQIDVLVVGDLFDAEGEALVHELRSVQPSLRIVGIRGLDDELRIVGVCATLPRPFSLDELREAVAAGGDAGR